MSAQSSPGTRTQKGTRPVAAFFISFAASAVLLGMLLVSDRRVFELRKARAEVIELDRQIAAFQAENEELQAAAEAARRHDFPAEKAAREELNLVAPGDLVLLYPAGRAHAQEDSARAPGQALAARASGLTFCAASDNVRDPDAGWSSLVARWAHNPKVASSNLAPATKKIKG